MTACVPETLRARFAPNIGTETKPSSVAHDSGFCEFQSFILDADGDFIGIIIADKKTYYNSTCSLSRATPVDAETLAYLATNA